ncbi:MAG: hypothetical protein AAGF11_42230 [Myxococcota bacterium]
MRRAVAALLFAFVAAIIVVAGSTRWLPPGRAGVDHVVFPLLAFPAIWIGFALVLFTARRPRRAWLTVVVITLAHGLLVAWGFWV